MEEKKNINMYDDNIALIQSTYDLLKRSDICTVAPDSIFTKYILKSAKIHKSLIDEHRLLVASCEINNNTKDDINKKVKSIDLTLKGEEELSRRKGFYQGTQFWERNYTINLLEIVYWTLFIIMTVTLTVKSGLNITSLISIIFFFIYPYITFYFIIYFIGDSYDYLKNNFNFYDNIYNHVK